MPNTRASQIATPRFDGEPTIASSLPGLPQGADQTDTAIERVAGGLGDLAGGFADTQAQREGQKAGAVAGLDPNWRPSNMPTLRGEAYDQAAKSTYVNTLQTQTRQAIADAYESYSSLPLDQQNPVAFKKQLDGMQQQFEAAHVFPSILPSFRKQWADQSFTYTQKAQDDNDRQVKDASNAAFLQNQQSASDSAMRAASLVTPAGDTLAQQEAEAHDRLVDAQINEGSITAVAGQKLKSEFRQNLSQTAIMAKFNKLDPAGQAAFLDNFQKGYGRGAGTSGAEAGTMPDAAAVAARSGTAMAYFTSHGWTQEQAAGIVGNLVHESALKTGARNAGDGADGSDSIGLAQWNGQRAKNLQAFAAATGADPKDYMTQLAFVQHELTTDHRAAGDALRRAANVRDATAAVVLGYEAPKGAETGVAENTRGWTLRLKAATDAAGLNPTAGLSDASYDTLRGQMASTIQRQQHAANALAEQGVHEIDAAQKQIEAGLDVTPDAWSGLQSKYATSTDPRVQEKLAETGAVRAAFAGFRGQTPQAIEAQLANAKTDAAQNGATPFKAAVLKAGQAYLTRYRADLAADPLDRAAKEGVIGSLQAIDFSQPASVASGLAARAPQARRAAQYFDRPPVYLLPDEAAQLKRLATAGGQPMLDAARGAVQALGPDADSLFRQVEGDAPAFATAGRVAAWGGSPSFLADLAQRQKLASDPATRGALELPPATDTGPMTNGVLGTALSAIPQMDAATRQAARQVYEVRAMARGLDRSKVDGDVFARTLQEAAGATFDGAQQYGGVADYKPPGWWTGSQKVLAPLGMKADGLPTAIGALRADDFKAMPQPPVAGDLKTAVQPAEIRSGYLTSVGHGQYLVSLNPPDGNDPHWVMQPNGDRFTLDLNALEPALRQRVPDIYRVRR